jgi:hypothetical protein
MRQMILTDRLDGAPRGAKIDIAALKRAYSARS